MNDTDAKQEAKRERQNKAERAFELLAAAKGYEATKRGWPDFLCLKDGRYSVVEVKPRTDRGRLKHLKHEQVVVMLFFQRLGVPCYVSDGEEAEPFSLRRHASNKSLKKLGLYPLPK